MAQIDWNQIQNGGQPKRRFAGANVKFFNSYNENSTKSLAEGRPIFDEIPSISIQFPGMDETCRRIEVQDKHEYADLYAMFIAGSEPVTSGTPLAEWSPLNGSAMRELQYMSFKTVEQLAAANDDVKRRMGPLVKFAKMAADWLAAANSPQAQVVKLTQQLEKAEQRTEKLEERIELLMQRIEGNEGTDLRPARVVARLEKAREALEEADIAEILEGEPTPAIKRRGKAKLKVVDT